MAIFYFFHLAKLWGEKFFFYFVIKFYQIIFDFLVFGYAIVRNLFAISALFTVAGALVLNEKL